MNYRLQKSGSKVTVVAFIIMPAATHSYTIDALKDRLNPELEIEGVLRTMFDVRNNLANAVSAELTTHFGDLVFRTIIPRNVRLAEAPSHGQSIVGYDRASRGGVAYLGLAGEIIRRNNERNRASGSWFFTSPRSR